jgi:hypothetical protein
MASAQRSLFDDPEQLAEQVHAVMTASVESVGVDSFYGPAPVRTVQQTVNGRTLPADITREEHERLMFASATASKPMQCVVEMRYFTGRLAVPVGPVTVETSATGMIYIHVDGRLMFTLHPDQVEIVKRHIVEVDD